MMTGLPVIGDSSDRPGNESDDGTGDDSAVER